MSNANLLIAANTIWVVVAAVLVMFMQAGFAFLEAGLTRMKNAAHIAGKNVLIFGVCSLVYWAVGFGIAFGDGNRVIGTSGFAPSVDSLLAVGKAPYSFFTTVPGAAGYMFEVVFAGVSLAIVWGAMAERAKLWVYFVFGAAFTLIYSVTSHWVWGGGWLFGLGMQDFAGSTVVHYQGALAALAGALLLGPRIGKFDGRRGNAIPGHNIPYAVLGTIILWFGWFGFNPGSTLGVLAVERIGIDDPIGAVAVHGVSGVWGTVATGLFAVPALAATLKTGTGGFVYTGSLHQVWVQLLGLAAVGAFTFSASFGCLWTMKRLWGIRVEEETETAGLDVSEHGMWGYPEFYIPVPGGYGTESHNHLLGHGHTHEAPSLPLTEPEAEAEAA